MVHGTGIGFRRDLAQVIVEHKHPHINFLEFAPENWIDVGGYWGRILARAAESYPFLCHGLSLSLGSPEDLDWGFLKKVKRFLRQYNVSLYSEHLSYAKCDNAHMYELLPIPFREDAARHVAQRIRQVQDFLGMRIAIENVSYYTPVAPQLSEVDFISSILEEADCGLLLDVNNVYVNAFNHRYDARQFIAALPLERVMYIHMAGHEQREPDLIIDTHGEAIIDPVFELFEWTVGRVKPVPVLLERDYNFPQFQELLGELERLNSISESAWKVQHAA